MKEYEKQEIIKQGEVYANYLMNGGKPRDIVEIMDSIDERTELVEREEIEDMFLVGLRNETRKVAKENAEDFIEFNSDIIEKEIVEVIMDEWISWLDFKMEYYDDLDELHNRIDNYYIQHVHEDTLTSLTNYHLNKAFHSGIEEAIREYVEQGLPESIKSILSN